MTDRATLADIAEQAGVSEATVSRVLNDRPGPSASTRQAVLTALDVLGYERPVGTGELSASTTLSYRSKTYQFEIPNPFIDQKSYALLDASLVYRADGGRWSVGLHGKNILDKEYKTSGYTFLAANPTTGALTRTAAGAFVPSLGREGTLTAFYGNPRQVFVSLGYNF